MEILTRGVIDEFIRKHPDSKASLNRWYLRTSAACWETPLDVKNTFSDVDHVGESQYVFNIKWNDYRLVAVINFETQIVNIKFIGTHAEYDKLNL
ncbi:MAG: type II toxin-antitoxin system HigB family toxin [Chitinophagales bacterium]|nr:type II toxin-antitoxin system HigB family toxin [Chitinophagales bacterium]